MTISRHSLLLLLGALVATQESAAQTTASPASYGSVALVGDFQPDPYRVALEAGGSIDAATLGSECAGFISDAPDYELSYSSTQGYPLSFFIAGDVDTTLVINGPSGSWYCNDDFDSAGGQRAGLVFVEPDEGTYDIWVGTYRESDTGADVELVITELGSPPWADSTAPDESDTITASGNGEPVLTSSGTGFVVSRNGHVLTNNHVVEGCRMLTFQVRGDLAVAADVLAVNAGTDLALLKTSLAGDPAVFRGVRNVRLGDELVVYGFPLFGELSSQGNLTNGIVSALSGLGDDLSRLQMTAPIQPGNSGGPVMNRAGHIVGVVVESANDVYFREQRGTAVQNLNFAIQDALARSFLDTNNVEYEIAEQADQTLAIADIAEQARRFTGQILCYQ